MSVEPDEVVVSDVVVVVSVSVSVSDYIKKNTSKEVLKEKRFAPPSLDEVTQYCNERENGIDPQRFIDFYESKGWMIGKNKMKDWQASVRNWARSEKKDNKKSERRSTDVPRDPDYTQTF